MHNRTKSFEGYPILYTESGFPYTNKNNLPMEVVNALLKDRYTVDGERESDYSASRVIAPVQQTILTQRNPDDVIVRDVIAYFFSFIGSIAHAVLEEGWDENLGSQIEERLYMDVLGKLLSGKYDVYHEPDLRDYKNTKAHKIMKGDYLEWEQQMNIYSRLIRHMGKETKTAKIIAFILDWKEHETFKKNYPQAPIVIIEIPIWTVEEQDTYINERIAKLKDAEATPSDKLHIKHPCTRREMWQDLKDIAIIKDGAARATKVFDPNDHFEAREFYDSNYGSKPGYKLVERYNDRTRCLKWCDVGHICQQNKDLYEAEGREWPYIEPLF